MRNRKLPDTPKPGLVIVRGTQTYQLERVEPHERRDGTMTRLGVWSSTCADCGAGFECGAPLGLIPEIRRCVPHRSKVRRTPRRLRKGGMWAIV
jgi:hypothetical protein